MLIDVNKIIVHDRIRKDYGDLQELADNIRENRLLHPPLVSANRDGTYTLITGERRLRAVRDILGYDRINANVRQLDDKDLDRLIFMEISENECRKDFTMTERLEYAKIIERIENAKAAERKRANGGDKKSDEYQKSDVANLPHPISDTGRTRDKVAEQIGVSATQLRHAQYIADNRDMVSDEDFAAWDEGKLSTNKVFNQIKAAKEKAEREAAQLKEEVAALEKQNDKLFEQVENAQEPRIVEREVVPADYAEAKRRTRELEHLEEVHRNDNKKLREWNQELRDKLDRAEGILNLDKTAKDVQNDVQFLVIATNNYVRQYGGLTWTFEQLSEVDPDTLSELKKAIKNLATFSSALTASLENINALN